MAVYCHFERFLLSESQEFLRVFDRGVVFNEKGRLLLD